MKTYSILLLVVLSLAAALPPQRVQAAPRRAAKGRTMRYTLRQGDDEMTGCRRVERCGQELPPRGRMTRLARGILARIHRSAPTFAGFVLRPGRDLIQDVLAYLAKARQQVLAGGDTRVTQPELLDVTAEARSEQLQREVTAEHPAVRPRLARAAGGGS